MLQDRKITNRKTAGDIVLVSFCELRPLFSPVNMKKNSSSLVCEIRKTVNGSGMMEQKSVVVAI